MLQTARRRGSVVQVKRVVGNLWDLHPDHWIVVPVNCGWNKRGRAIMGTGVALQAAQRFPHLREVWGRSCREAARSSRAEDVNHASLVRFDAASRCVLFPTKPLDAVKPALSWRLPADLNLVEQSAITLDAVRSGLREDGVYIERVALPLVGCGAGGLAREQVLPILEQHLDDNFTLVEPERLVWNSSAASRRGAL